MKKELKDALKEGLINAGVFFGFFYAYTCIMNNASLVTALKPALLVGLLRFVSYLAQALDYVELPNFKELSDKEKFKNSFKNIFRFVRVGR